MLLIVTGCTSSSGSDSSGQPPNTLSVVGDDQFRFTPRHLTATTGSISIELRATGAYPHNISFPTLHATSATVRGDIGRDTTTLRLSVDEPGTYRFICTYHDQAGMTGELVVH